MVSLHLHRPMHRSVSKAWLRHCSPFSPELLITAVPCSGESDIDGRVGSRELRKSGMWACIAEHVLARRCLRCVLCAHIGRRAAQPARDRSWVRSNIKAARNMSRAGDLTLSYCFACQENTGSPPRPAHCVAQRERTGPNRALYQFRTSLHQDQASR